MFMFTRGSFVFHEIRQGKTTWCGKEQGVNGYREENSKFVEAAPNGLDFCQNCAKVKSRPWISESRQKRESIWQIP
jgi:hypothetical protein